MNDTHAQAYPWTAQWIWPDLEHAANQWVCFRKQVRLDAAPQAAEARIAVDSKYWLWVNGETVVREGGLKRGPTPRDTYFDTIDLTEHLTAGVNTIAVLVWYWGKRPNYSHNDSGHGGLLLDCPAIELFSDASWRATVHPSFQHREVELPWQNPTWPVIFDARDEPVGWHAVDFDDSAWPAVAELAAPPCEPWNELVARPIPFWKDYGLREFENEAELPKQTSLAAGECASFTARLPYNAQFTPLVEIAAPAGTTMRMTTDIYDDGKIFAEYVTREGEQAWESPAWINGHELNVTITAPADAAAEVKLNGLRYRETGIDTEFVGHFDCDDSDLNRLWQMSARTTYLCIRDNFMDCPDRERAQWWGDAVNEILLTLYAFDATSHASIAKGIREIFAWQRPDGVLASPVPHCAGERSKELPAQMQAGVWIVWQYHLHTDDLDLLKEVAPAIWRWLELWETRKDDHGLYEPAGEWLWFDAGEPPPDGKRICNFLHAIVLQRCVRIANAIDDAPRALACMRRLEALVENCGQLLERNGVFGPDDRANALAVLAGLVGSEQTPAVLDLLTATCGASPYMERYVEEALCRLGRSDLSVERMKRRYAPMLASGSSTLYEHFPTRGTKNHAWAGGPLYIASAYLAGLTPLEPGWIRFAFSPRPGPLTRFDVDVPTVRGTIHAAMATEAAGVVFTLDAPAEAVCEVSLPCEDPRRCRLVYNGRELRPAADRYVVGGLGALGLGPKT